MGPLRSEDATTMNQELEKLLIRQAAELHEAVRCGKPDAQERMATWLTESRHAVRIMMQTYLLDHELEHINLERQRDAPEGPIPDGSNIVQLGKQADAPSPLVAARSSPRWAVAAALAGIAILLGGWWWLTARQQFSTVAGEQRTLTLEDGSIVQLNARSSIRINFSAQRRDVRLLTGEALFTVHRDQRRPFRVMTSDATVQSTRNGVRCVSPNHRDHGRGTRGKSAGTDCV